MLKNVSFKVVHFVLLASLVYSTDGISKSALQPISTNQAINIPLTNAQLVLEQNAIAAQLNAVRKAEDARLEQEFQQRSEQRLMDLIGTQELQFKSVLVNIYGQTDYILLWEDKAAEKAFLREYATMVSGGISKRSAKSLEALGKAAQTGGLVYDILLTDAFLDYLYYANNVMNSAQKWLYSVNAYQALPPTREQIQSWLSAVKKGENLKFVTALVPQNVLYQQTTAKLSSLLASGSTDKKTIYKLAVNAQRLRIIPSFDNGIFVNIPSYQLEYRRDGKLVLTSRVIVGRKDRKTPVMYSQLSNVVVNPPWNPTPRLINEDLVPKIKLDPSYVTRNGYTILDSKGREIDPYSIDWATIGSRFPYHIRQAPGDSALGNYKFNMPSSDAIYLHDTPNHALFGRKNRALSSGCIRVNKADALASILLKEAGWTESKKQQVLNSKKTVWADIRSDNPVYLYYVTAWVDNGKVQTLPDIYGYDISSEITYINWDTVNYYLN
ncbi:MAG: L,D-transpeptidase family protein [[Pasteurella] mairii]|uniref:Putative L,D-transpeptidase 7 n=1 Tax=[Pasteurella] mairii TaxID=757 RepID=A0A379B525_9PAST|nr:L,D-transpeptidase family protein [[Pasteurella] mairii]SUB33707.1 putative L,D-transpeptidase 7 [[Pasteurella] mairii]